MTSLQARLLPIVLRPLTRKFLAGDVVGIQRRMGQSLNRVPTPRGVTVKAETASGVPGEWLTPANAAQPGVLLYFHGGGFVLGSPASHRGMVAKIVRQSGIRALSLDYRLAPEHPFPAALEDTVAAYRWLLEKTEAPIAPSQIILGGDSAGGNLALATLLRLRELSLPMPAAAVCLSPVTDLSGSPASRRTMARVDPILPPETAAWIATYLAGADPRQPLASPLFGDLAGLPPLLLQVGTLEILYDDSTLLAEKARQAGVAVTLEIYQGLWHVFQMSANVPEAGAAIRSIGKFIKSSLSA